MHSSQKLQGQLWPPFQSLIHQNIVSILILPPFWLCNSAKAPNVFSFQRILLQVMTTLLSQELPSGIGPGPYPQAHRMSYLVPTTLFSQLLYFTLHMSRYNCLGGKQFIHENFVQICFSRDRIMRIYTLFPHSNVQVCM